MAKLRQTTEVRGHTHLVFIQNDGTGLTSKVSGHFHNVAYNPPQEPITDETGQVIQEATPGGFIILGAGKANHIHELAPVKYENIEISENEDDVVSRVQGLFKYALEIESESIESGKESEDFYRGEQWENGVKNSLEGSGRAAVTINETKPKVDLLSGFQRQNRTDIIYLPVEGGDAITADIYSQLVKNILEQNNFGYEETMVFLDQLVPGRGNFNLYIDYSKDLRGEIIIEHEVWDEVFWLPHNKLDGSDAEGVIRRKFISFNKAKQLFPEKKDEIEQEIEMLEQFRDILETEKVHHQVKGEQYLIGKGRVANLTKDPEFVDEVKKQFGLIELQQLVVKKVPVYTDGDEFYFNAINMSKEQIEEMDTIGLLNKVMTVQRKVNVHKIIGSVLLESFELPFTMFSVIPAYGNKSKNFFYGKVETVKDMQRWLNKYNSKIIDVVNKADSYGWTHEVEAFEDEKQKTKFKKLANIPGAVKEVADMTKIQQDQGVRPPTELLTASELASQKMNILMNVNEALLGLSKASESGVAIARKQRQALIGNEYLFDNLSLAKKRLGLLLIEAIQLVYTPERILRIIDNKNMKDKVELLGIPYEFYDKELLYDILSNSDATRLDVAVGEATSSPTALFAQNERLLEMAARGLFVPPELIVETIPGLRPEFKEKIKEGIVAQQQAAMQEQQMKRDMEIQKTMIAAQSKNPMMGQQGQESVAAF